MTMVNMSHFMNKDFPPVFLQVFPADDNILHPTERSYLLIMHHKCNPFLQLLMFAGMYQPKETKVLAQYIFLEVDNQLSGNGKTR